MSLFYRAPKDIETENAPMTPEKPLGALTVTSFIFNVLFAVDPHIALTLQSLHRARSFLSFLPKKVHTSSTETFSVLHQQMHT